MLICNFNLKDNISYQNILLQVFYSVAFFLAIATSLVVAAPESRYQTVKRSPGLAPRHQTVKRSPEDEEVVAHANCVKVNIHESLLCQSECPAKNANPRFECLNACFAAYRAGKNECAENFRRETTWN